jgi:hypothetical protein
MAIDKKALSEEIKEIEKSALFKSCIIIGPS